MLALLNPVRLMMAGTITKGAYCRFDENSSKQLAELLRAVALFATGGIVALENKNSDAARLLFLGQIR